MDNNFCKTCAYYRQHYTFDHCKIFRVYCGHCTYQKAKTKRPDAQACEHYLWSESAENAFATKEFLSKVLVEYVLKLELLPEIFETEKEK